MKVKVEGRTINVDDKIVDTFAKISRPLTDESVGFMLKMDEIDVSVLSDEELEKATNNSLLNELKELEYLSRPETVQAAIDFANRK